MNPYHPENLSIEASALGNLSIAVIVFDTDLKVCYLNQTAEMMLAVSERHVLGQLPEGWLACHEESMSDLINASAVGQPITKRGVTLRLHSGAKITVDCTIGPIIAETGQTMIVVELQQIDRHLRISREERLINQQAVTRDVVRGLAHEIKNPLGGLRGAAQLLEAELSSAELREYTQVIIEEADRLQGLVNRMLGPNRRPEYTMLNIHSVLERVRKLVLAESGKQIEIERDYDPSLPELIGDMDQLIQAVLNIVRNAVRAAEGAGLITLKTRVQRRFTIGNHCHRLVAQVDIIDDGPGIPPAISETLFYPMVTAEAGGMGLGLSITQSLINNHNGLVECRSRPGKTVFTILLPLDSQFPQSLGEG